MEPAEVQSLLEIEDSSAEAWCSVFQRLIINMDRINSSGTSEIVCNGLLKKVKDIGCKDKCSVWKIITIINSWIKTADILIPDNFDLPLCELKGGDLDLTHPDYPMEVKFNHNISILSISYENSGVQVINFLLNYGFLHPISGREAIDYGYSTILMLYDLDIPHDTAIENFGKWYYRLQLFDPLKFPIIRGCGVSQRGFKRILLVALCLGVYLYRDTNNPEQSFQCLRLYFRAVADPFVQAAEFGELLRFFLFEVREDRIDKIVQDFKRLYPESQKPYRPRSLKHLCRCAIRQKLSDRPEVLPMLLDDLGPLPPFLKSYIMGDL